MACELCGVLLLVMTVASGLFGVALAKEDLVGKDRHNVQSVNDSVIQWLKDFSTQKDLTVKPCSHLCLRSNTSSHQGASVMAGQSATDHWHKVRVNTLQCKECMQTRWHRRPCATA